MSLDDLQKALAGRISAKEFRYGNNYWQNAITEEDLKKILTQFFGELSSNFVLVSRKQLSDMVAEFKQDGTTFLQKYGYCQIIKLFEGSGKENQK